VFYHPRAVYIDCDEDDEHGRMRSLKWVGQVLGESVIDYVMVMVFLPFSLVNPFMWKSLCIWIKEVILLHYDLPNERLEEMYSALQQMAFISMYRMIVVFVILPLNCLTLVNLPYLAASMYHSYGKKDFCIGKNMQNLRLNVFKDGGPECIERLLIKERPLTVVLENSAVMWSYSILALPPIIFLALVNPFRIILFPYWPSDDKIISTHDDDDKSIFSDCDNFDQLLKRIQRNN